MEEFGSEVGSEGGVARRRWSLAFAGTVAASFVIGFVLARSLPDRPKTPEPTVFSLVFIKKPETDLFTGRPTETESEFEAFLNQQLSLAKSPSVLHAVLANREILARIPALKSQSDPEGWLRDRLRVELLPGTSLMRVSAIGMSPPEQSRVVNEVVKSYIVCYDSYIKSINSYILQEINNYYNNIDARVRRARQDILDLEAQIPRFQLEDEAARERFKSYRDKGDESKPVAESKPEEDFGKSVATARARIKFLESDLRPLEEIRDRIVLERERRREASRDDERIAVIEPARSSGHE